MQRVLLPLSGGWLQRFLVGTGVSGISQSGLYQRNVVPSAVSTVSNACRRFRVSHLGGPEIHLKIFVVIGEGKFKVWDRSVGEVSSDDHAATSSCLGRIINSADDVQRAMKGKMKKPSVNVNI